MPFLPNDMWKLIASFLDQSDYPTRGSLRSVSSFFAQDTEISASYFRDVIRTNFLDYVHQNELANYIPCTLDSLKFDAVTFKKLLVTFYSQVEEKRLKLFEFLEADESDSEFEFDIGDFADCVRNIMYSATKSGHIAILKLLIESDYCEIGDFINDKDSGTQGEEKMTALAYAAAFGRKQIFSLLLQNGAEFTVGEIMSWDTQHLIYVDLGYYFKTALTPLHIIALGSDEIWLLHILEDFPLLLRPVFSENFKKCLEWICKDNPEQLERLLETDASLIAEMDVGDWSLFHWASCLDKTLCMEILIKNGADLDAGNISPLYLACAGGKLSALKILISHKVPIEPFNMNQSTCLHLTANNGHTDCIQFLIEECKLDINAENDGGETPLYLAQLEVDSEDRELNPLVIAKKAKCAELLQSLGAKNERKARPFDY